METRIALLHSLILLLAITASAQPSLEEKIDDVVRRQMGEQKVPGLSLAVVKDGKPVVVKGYGLANVEHSVPVKPETVFQSGSIGKQFTSFAVMLLVEDGKIRLDEKISAYLGDVPESWSNITVRHLLTHTSGMTDYDWDFRKDYTEDEMLEMAKKIPTAFKPGERWMYSNLGYLVLGVMVGKVSGQFYGDLLQERVFKPLGMKTARVISESDIVPNRAAGYRLVDGELKNQNWVSPTANSTGDGALYFTSADLIKWDAALRDRKLLSQKSYDEMWTPVKLNNGRTSHYGFGWVLKRVNSRRIIEHGGSWQGFQSFITRYPDNRLTVIVFGNLRQMDPSRFAHYIAEEADPSLKPRVVSAAQVGDIGKICEVYEKIAAGDFESGFFSEELLVKIRGELQELFKWPGEEGPVKRLLLLDEEETDWGREFSIRAEHAKTTFFVKAVIDKDGKISVFDLDQD
ncbi:MAG: beta-lactamase family protein [Acidobacteriota bacterium]|nr:MAG: beta-lactamase family protein [Acidobacteriota bacterium]